MKSLLITLSSTLLAVFLVACSARGSGSPVAGSLLINEVLYMEQPGASDLERTHEWVEIHNPGLNDRNLSGWTLASRSGIVLFDLPGVDLPAGAYLVVNFTNGVDDLDFSDNKGDVYSLQAGSVLDDAEDEIGLFSDAPDSSTVIDFINWKSDDAAAVYAGVPYRYAVDAGIWTVNTFFDSTQHQNRPFERTRTVRPGTSIGRDKDSTDTDSPGDWDAHGGVDALDITPGSRNLAMLALTFPPPPPPPPQAEWTFMVYMNGDSNLELAAFDDLTEMERSVNSADVNVVVMVDGLSRITEVERIGGVLRPVPGRPKGATWRGQVKHDTDPKLVYLYPAAADAGGGYYLGERNLGDPMELRGFVNWATANYPARKYALVIWDHGLGWKGISYDQSSSDDALRMGELERALNGLSADLIGYDACLMGMIEVAQQSSGFGSVFVGSEEVEDFDGWPYDAVLFDLKANPAMAAPQLGTVIVNRYAQFYSAVAPDPYFTMAAVDLGAGFNGLVQDVNSFGAEMKPAIDDIDRHFDQMDNEQIDIQVARNQAEEYFEEDFIDLSHLSELIEASPLLQQYKTRAQPIVDRLAVGAGVIIAEAHGAQHPNSHGLSIYFPRFQTKSRGGAPGCGGGACGAPDDAGDPFDDPSTEKDTAGSQQVIYAEDTTDENGAVPYFGPSPHPLPQAPGFRFPAMTSWDEFLHRYYKPAADAGPDSFHLWGSTVTLDGIGSSDSDGDVTLWLWDLHSGRDEPPLLGGGRCLGTPEDSECDLRDETNDDPELNGPQASFQCLEPEYDITLSVHDDHFRQTGHDNHWKTDQSEVTVYCIPCIKRIEREYIVPGETFTWFIDITNPGESTAEVKVTDVLVEGLSLLEARSNGLDIHSDGSTIVARGQLASKATEVLELDLELVSGYDWPYVFNRVEYEYGASEPAVCEGRIEVRVAGG